MWDNSDLVTHEVMGGLKNVYAIGAGNCNLFKVNKSNFFTLPIGKIYSENTRKMQARMQQ